MAFSVCLVHKIMKKDEHRVAANTSAICQGSVAAQKCKFNVRLPSDRMRSGVPLVVSLRRSPEGSILKAVQYPSGLLERGRRQCA